MNIVLTSRWKQALLALPSLLAICATTEAQVQGPSSSQTPYLLPVNSAYQTVSLLTVGDSVNNKPSGAPYRMVGIPDGLGAYDNGDGTFTVLMNHEIGANQGVVRAHGSAGSFVSKWVIEKDSLKVLNGSDLIQQVGLWNGNGFTLGTTAIGRLCSADLPEQTAFWNPATGLGTSERIFMNGEEVGDEGRAFGTVVSTGIAYQLPHLGKFSWENSVASPYAQDKTVVIGLDDSSPGQVYMYLGNKQNTGNEVERAGLVGGGLYGLQVVGGPQLENRVNGFDGTPNPDSMRFAALSEGNASALTGAQLQAQSTGLGVTNFLRPEDGAWDPNSPNDFYFVTTDRFSQVEAGTGAQDGYSRLYRLRFDDITNPAAGGQIDALLDGEDVGQMYDNMTVTPDGLVILQEDVGGQAHLGKVLVYNIATGGLEIVLEHDRARFGDFGIAPVAPFNNDEEASGVIDISHIFNDGRRHYLMDVQAHYGLGGELVQGGQLLLARVPEGAQYLTGCFGGALALLAAARRRMAK